MAQPVGKETATVQSPTAPVLLIEREGAIFIARMYRPERMNALGGYLGRG
jgi:hypothetical protein